MKIFRLILVTLVAIFFVIMPDNVYAEENYTLININVEGGENRKFKAGEEVTIKIDIDNLSNLYAASFCYTYDNAFLQVNSIDVDEKISSEEVYAPYKDTAKNGNKARYCFTLLGDRAGLSGSYNFATIKGKTLKDGKVEVGKDNITFQLVNKKDNDMINGDYKFKTSEGDIYKVTNIIEDTKNVENQSTLGPANNKGKSEMKIELVGKADELKDNKEENTSNEEVTKEFNEEGSDADSYSLKDSEDEKSLSPEEKASNKYNTIILVGGVLVIVTAVIFVIYRRKK